MRSLFLTLFLSLISFNALGAAAAGAPTQFPIPWGDSAGAGYIRTIPEASQIGITAGAASLTDGFPPVTFLPTSAGGTPPFGQDFNGILNETSLADQWQQMGWIYSYNASFSASIGGYPAGAILRQGNNSGLWMSLIDNNTSDPDTGGSGWAGFAAVTAEKPCLSGFVRLGPTFCYASAAPNFITLSSGDNTVTAPSGAVAVMIYFEATAYSDDAIGQRYAVVEGTVPNEKTFISCDAYEFAALSSVTTLNICTGQYLYYLNGGSSLTLVAGYEGSHSVAQYFIAGYYDAD